MGGVVVLLVVIVLVLWVLASCIPHCTTGLCSGTGTSWCLQGYLEYRNPFQGSVH